MNPNEPPVVTDVGSDASSEHGTSPAHTWRDARNTLAFQVRGVVATWAFQFRHMSRSGLFVVAVLVEPLVIATLVFLISGAQATAEQTRQAFVGVVMLCLWSATTFGSGQTLRGQRHLGTLEYLVLSPTPMLTTLIGLSVGSTTLGIYSLAVSYGFGVIVAGLSLAGVHALNFALALLLAIVCIAVSGLMVASLLVLLPHGYALANMLSFPAWILCGFFVPVEALPRLLQPVSWLLPPTWAASALRSASAGGSATPELAVGAAVTAVYALLSLRLLRLVDQRVRVRGTLSMR